CHHPVRPGASERPIGGLIDMDTIGVIGLGLMGAALAERFLRSGGFRAVVGYDVRPQCRRHLAELGGEPVESSRAVFARTRLVVLSLPNSAIVAEVLAGVGDVPAGATIIDTTTGDPDAVAELGRQLATTGVDYLDATLTGSSALALAGELIVTAG